MDDQQKRLFDAFSETLNVWRAVSDALAGGDPEKLSKTAESISSAWLSALGINNAVLQELASSKGPLTPEDLQRLAAELLRNPQFAQQAQSFTQPPSDDKIATDGAQLLTTRAYRMLQRERYPEARSHFHKAIEIKSTHKPPWQGLAQSLTALGLPDAADDAQAQADSLPD
jgi:hypothetical protein